MKIKDFKKFKKQFSVGIIKLISGYIPSGLLHNIHLVKSWVGLIPECMYYFI